MQIFEGRRPAPVEVSFAGPAPQRRLSVGFRIVLAIPLFVALIFLGLALAICGILGWFSALVIGRLPEGMAGFLIGCVRYYTRVTSYLYLLTDRYPPFSLSPGSYPVDVRAAPGRLNRLAVFFRLLLALPAYVVVAVVGNGIGVAIFFVWLITLVAGTMPMSLYQAMAAVVRYQVRFYSYLGMLTGAYPAGLFGDPSSSGVPGDPAPGPGEPSSPYPFPPPPLAWPAASTPPFPPPPLFPPSQDPPLANRLVLTVGARRIVVLFVGLGVLAWGGSIAADVVTGTSRFGDLHTLSALDTDYGRLSTALAGFEAQTSHCEQSGGGLPCVEQADAALAPSFSRFATQVAGLQVPAAYLGQAQLVVGDARRLSRDLAQLASEPSATAYESASAGFQADGTAFDSDVRSLREDLLNG